MAIFPKLIYIVNAIPFKILAFFFASTGKIIKFLAKWKGARRVKQPWKESSVGGLSNFKTYCKTTVIKIVRNWNKICRSMEQNWESWNNPYTLGQMSFDKVSRSFSVERMVFLTEGGGAGWIGRLGLTRYTVLTLCIK